MDRIECGECGGRECGDRTGWSHQDGVGDVCMWVKYHKDLHRCILKLFKVGEREGV